MLASMRNTVNGIFAKSLMMFLVITFAVWGIGDIFRGGMTANTLVSVGDSDITGQEFGRKLQEIQRGADGSLPPEVLNSPMMRNQILQMLIEERLVGISTRELGIAVGTDLIAKSTKENLAFQNVDGSFDAKKFETYLRSTGQSEAAYSQNLGKELARQLYADAVRLDQLSLPKGYLTLSSLSLAERRGAKILTFRASGGADADETALNDFYEQHKNDFYMLPESRDVRIAILSNDSIKRATKGDTSGTAFEELGYTIDDAIAAGQSMDEALKAAKLEATITALSKATQDGGKNDVERTALEQAFALNEGESSGLMSAKDGTYFMVHVDAVMPESPKPFDSVKSDVAKRYQQAKGAELAKEKAMEFKVALNGEDSLNAQLKLVANKKVEARDSGLLQRPEIATSKNIPAALHKGIFGASKGDVVGPVLTSNGDYALAIVTSIDVPKTALEPNKETQDAMKNELGGAVYNLMLTDLVKRHPIKQVGSLTEGAAQ